MGYTGVSYREIGKKGNYYDYKSFLDKEYTWNDNTYEESVVKSAFYGNCYYAAVQQKNKITNETIIYGLVVVTSVNDDEYFYFKPIHESSGPHYFDCPKRILEKLTKTNDERAIKWRNKCLIKIKMKNFKERFFDKAKRHSSEYYIKYTIDCPIVVNSDVVYNKGDCIILHYGLHNIHGTMKKCWSDSVFRWKESLLSIKNCILIDKNEKEVMNGKGFLELEEEYKSIQY